MEKPLALAVHVCRWGLALALATLVGSALGGCAASHPPMRTAPAPTVDRAQVGVASYYARKFHGRRTASGVRYDMHEMTAAHPSLPFGTRVRVTSLESGKSVVVVINDRGPWIKGRIIDVSYAAARKLEMIGPGTIEVRVEIVS